MGQKLRRVVSGGRMESSTINAVGIWFYCVATDSYLYLMRNDIKHPGTWGLPGGKIEPGETLIATVQRECQEELGFVPPYTNLVPLEKFTSSDNYFAYHTFFSCVAEEFQPKLNHEHVGYAWIKSGSLPKPMHPGLWSTVNFDVIRDKISILHDLMQANSLKFR